MNSMDIAKLKQELENLSENEISDEIDYINDCLCIHNDFNSWFSYNSDDVSYMKLKFSILEQICLDRGYYDKWYSK